MLLFEDIALVPIIFLLGVLGTGARDLSALGANIGLGLAVVIGLFLAGKLVLPRLFAQAARTKSPELFLCVALLVVILASIATMSVGLSTLMGALIAGMVIAESRYGEEVRSVIAPFMNLALGGVFANYRHGAALAAAGRKVWRDHCRRLRHSHHQGALYGLVIARFWCAKLALRLRWAS